MSVLKPTGDSKALDVPSPGPTNNNNSSSRANKIDAQHIEGAQPTAELSKVVDGDVSYGPNGIRGIVESPYVCGAALLASLGGFSFGYDQGVISIINKMDQFHAAFPQAVTSFGEGFMTGMLLFGAFVGCLLMPYLADRISRKWALTVVVCIFNVGAIMQTAAPSYGVLVAGRAIGGVGVGTLAMTAPVYICEIAPPNLRGTLLVLESVSLVSGVVIAFWITFATRHIAGEASFRLPFGLQMVSATVLGTAIHLFPYSPRWLALAGREPECLAALARLRRRAPTDALVQTEFKSILADVEFKRLWNERAHAGRTGLRLELLEWADLFKRGMWRRTAVGVGVAFFQQFTGINAFIYYAPTLFESIGQDPEASLVLSGVFNCLQLVAVVVCFLVVDRVGRRPLAIWGAFACAACYVVIAVLDGLYGDDWAAHRAEGWACAAMSFLFIIIYGVSYSPLAWALPSEVFSIATRAKGVALSTCTIFLCNFIVATATPSMIADIGFGTYVFFAAFCTLSGFWALWLVKETSGRTLEEMDELFGGDGRLEDELKRMAAVYVNDLKMPDVASV